jgi:hypothetical protein
MADGRYGCHAVTVTVLCGQANARWQEVVKGKLKLLIELDWYVQ